MTSQVELSVVIPAYNSAEYIGDTVHRVVEYCHAQGVKAEVLVCDDGSTDGTASAVPRLPNVSVWHSPVNRGKGSAVRTGMGAATGAIRAFTDADLPYGVQPLESARFYISDRRFHAVIGDRTLPGSTYEQSGPIRRLVSGAASLAFRTMVTGGIYDTQCGFKAFRGDVAAEVFRLSRVDRFAFDVEIIYLLLKHRLDIKRVPVRLEANAPSSVSVGRDTMQATSDIVRMRLNWALGRYVSPRLGALLAQDLQLDRRPPHAELG